MFMIFKSSPYCYCPILRLVNVIFLALCTITIKTIKPGPCWVEGSGRSVIYYVKVDHIDIDMETKGQINCDNIS